MPNHTQTTLKIESTSVILYPLVSKKLGAQNTKPKQSAAEDKESPAEKSSSTFVAFVLFIALECHHQDYTQQNF